MIDLVRLLPQSPLPFSLPVNEKWHVFLHGENCSNRPFGGGNVVHTRASHKVTSGGKIPSSVSTPPREPESPERPSDIATDAARFWEAAQEPRSRFRSLLFFLDLRESVRTAPRCPILAVAVRRRISRLPPHCHRNGPPPAEFPGHSSPGKLLTR
jgi:hypothetical protein